MKNIQYIILLTLFIGLTSCVVESHQDGKATEAGQIIYTETKNTIKNYINTVNLAQRIDFYLQSSSKKRDSLKIWLLEGYTILEVDNSVIVKGRVDWKIARNSNDSLGTPSSRWTIHQSTNEGATQILQMTAEDQKNTWNILAENSAIEYYNAENINKAHLQIQMLTNYPFIEDYILNSYSVKMAGSTPGTIMSNPEHSSDTLTCSYTITQPLLLENYRTYNHFIEGEIEMEVTRTNFENDNTGIDDILATISANGSVSISFRGITEIWEY